MKKQQSGFTLIEIAIVMVIIGLLLGGVLKGQEMMTNAKIKRGVNDYNGMSAAVFSYLDRYSALPGDDPNANGRWGSVAPTNGTLGDGLIAGVCTSVTTTDETAAVIENLRQSGSISGTGYPKQTTSFIGIVSLMAWGLGYFGQPHILVRFMSIRHEDEMHRAKTIGMTWMILSVLGSLAVGFFGFAYVLAEGVNLQDSEKIFRSEERRVGKECRSRWSPDH